MNASLAVARLGGVHATLVPTLTARAADSLAASRRRPHDSNAERVCRELGLDPCRCGHSLATIRGVTARAAWFDARCLWALRRLACPLFLSLGSGLDTMYERVAARAGPYAFDWIDSDLPEVVRLRRGVLPDAAHRTTRVLDLTHDDWLDALDLPIARPVVFLAQGVLMYLEPGALAQVFQCIAARFAGRAPVQFVFDWASPAMQSLAYGQPTSGPAHHLDAVYRSSLTRARDIAGFDPLWHIVAQGDPMCRAGWRPLLFSLTYRLSTYRRFMGCAHAVLA